ncbi:MAG: hypothetical protein Kow0089_21850 [Desulfobulbaceae bacterium]
MKAIDHSQAELHVGETLGSLLAELRSTVAQRSETIWLCITFLLFIVMGPFSVIAVLYGLWALAHGENRERMSEPASCEV